MSDIHFQGFWRMDWGLGNPNKTAALIATLMVAVWLLAYIRKWSFWTALVLFTALCVCLIHTYSRGGLVGAFAGLAVVVWKLPRPCPWKRIAAVLASIWIMIGFSLCLHVNERFGQGVLQDDGSITNRLEIWKVAPQMMADAPGGWGIGNSGKAYMDWYQPLDRSESYRTLVNSHLTWLVEFGWPLRFLYVLAWLAVFTLCWPANGERWMAVPLGVWAAFAITALFSSVAESPWLWLVPSLSLFAVLIYRISRNAWRRPAAWLFPACSAVVITLGFFLLGQSKSEIRKSGNVVVVGKGEPGFWVFVDTRTLGKHYGKTLRKSLASTPGTKAVVAVAESITAPANHDGKIVVLAGTISDQDKRRFEEVLLSAKKIVLLNPTFFPQEVSLPKDRGNLEVVFGEFSQSAARSAWEEQAIIHQIRGCGDYLPAWPAILLAMSSM